MEVQVSSAVARRSSFGGASGKFLAFELAEEEFAIPVHKVKEIIGLQEITHVPQTARYVRGVINLRGKVVPVVDLRLKLHMAGGTYNERSCIVVLQIETQGGAHNVGVAVDSVSEVVNIPATEMEERDSFSHGLIQAAYIKGVAKIRGKVKILLDMDSVLSDHEIEQLDAVRGRTN